MPILNEGRHLNHIVKTTTCVKHHSQEEVPCWAIEGGKRGNFVLGVCGDRIKQAGYNGKITAMSLQLKTPGGRGGVRKR
jgi:hypothetical protein